MIVVGIMGIVLTMSVPLVYKVWRKAPMRKAVADVVEVCSVTSETCKVNADAWDIQQPATTLDFGL